MAKERYLGQIPFDVRERVGPIIAGELEEFLSWQEDFPHRKAHVLEALFCLKYTDELIGDLGPLGWDLAARTLRLHDKGYAFVEKGILRPEEHHFGSALIASKIESDPRILQGILHHVDDILPEGIPLWIRVVRDIDRICRIGFTGLNAMAHYLDFTYPSSIGSSEEEMIEKRILCEFNDPYLDEYELPAEAFFIEWILPFLCEDKQRLAAMLDILYALRVRVIGNPGLGIEPVHETILDLYRIKLSHTARAEGYLRGNQWMLDAPHS